MEHLSLEIFDLPTKENPKPTGSKYAVLEEDISITITDTNEIFASGDVWSYSFRLNVHANSHIFGTAGDIHGSLLHDQINHRRTRLWVEGTPMYLGYLKLDDEAEVDKDGNVDVSFESGQKTFDDMIDGAKANQVPMIGKVRFGVALWRKRILNFGLHLEANPKFSDGVPHPSPLPAIGDADDWGKDYVQFVVDGDNAETPAQEYPRMVFPKGTFWHRHVDGQEIPINCLNTDSPYSENENGTPINPYCNVALCYQRYGYHKKDQYGNEYDDYNAEPEAERGYEVMPADRVNSAPNFFVLYWIRALMKHLGIYIEENQMMDVEDLRRLFFVNTKCAYKEPKYMRPNIEQGFGEYRFIKGQRLIAEQFDPERTISAENSKLENTGYTISGPNYPPIEDEADREAVIRQTPRIEGIQIIVRSALPWSDRVIEEYEDNNCLLHDAYATSDCFPDVDISEVISAIENGFGVRFLFSDNFQRVRIVLLKNVFKNEDRQDIQCDIIEETKMENNIRGFRMTFGNTEDTQFYYKGFADKLPHKKELWPDDSDTHDYSKWDLNAEYSDIINKVSAFNKTCYVTPVNGNAYGVKIDKDAKRYEELHPSLFEFAGFMDAEDGDCTGEEETIEEINVGFTPAIMNDLNMEAERKAQTDEDRKQQFALFVDAEMQPRRPDLQDGNDYNKSETYYSVDEMYKKFGAEGTSGSRTAGDGFVAPGRFAIASDLYATQENLTTGFTRFINGALQPDGTRNIYGVTWNVTDMGVKGYINEGYRLYLQDNYKPNDDGIPPIETKDWGLTLGIMRGSGSDAYVDYDPDPDDGQGNDTWEIVPGSSTTSHPDTCDSYGNEWDYDGQHVISSAAGARAELPIMFPESNAAFYVEENGYITWATIMDIYDDKNTRHSMMFAEERSKRPYLIVSLDTLYSYARSLQGHSVADIMAMDAAGYKLIIEPDSSYGRIITMLRLCAMAYGGRNDRIIIDDGGVESSFGRFSLKLRAEKPNPKYKPDPTKPETDIVNKQYLDIENPNLRHRGLCDQFYKEYSYWVRNARIVKKTVTMELSQLLSIDKTKRVKVGDTIGFIRKMQYSVSNKTGLGTVTMEIMYI